MKSIFLSLAILSFTLLTNSSNANAASTGLCCSSSGVWNQTLNSQPNCYPVPPNYWVTTATSPAGLAQADGNKLCCASNPKACTAPTPTATPTPSPTPTGSGTNACCVPSRNYPGTFCPYTTVTDCRKHAPQCSPGNTSRCRQKDPVATPTPTPTSTPPCTGGKPPTANGCTAPMLLLNGWCCLG